MHICRPTSCTTKNCAFFVSCTVTSNTTTPSTTGTVGCIRAEQAQFPGEVESFNIRSRRQGRKAGFVVGTESLTSMVKRRT